MWGDHRIVSEPLLPIQLIGIGSHTPAPATRAMQSSMTDGTQGRSGTSAERHGAKRIVP